MTEELYELPGHLIRRLQQEAVAIFVAKMADHGYDLRPVQYAALKMTQNHPGLDQATLAGLIAYDRATIGGVVDRLVQKGLVERSINGRDRRARELRLTSAGLEVLNATEPLVRELQLDILSGLEEEEAAVFLTLLKKATNALNEHRRASLRFDKD